MEEDVTRNVSDYVDMLKRRKWALVIPACAVFLIAFVVALVYPPVYRSTSTILIEGQEIPIEFVKTTVTGYAEQRLQTINQRIMSSTKLLEIINRFDLYPDLRKKLTTEEIIEIMRKDIKFATISADVVDRERGGATPSPITIAFTLSYEGKKPLVVQQVTGVLSSLFLEENLKVREERTTGASRFLQEETNEMQKKLSGIDAKIARYKEQHIHELPELQQVNMSGLDRTERDMDMLRQQLSTLREREGYYQAQLITIPTDAANQDRTLLKELKARLVQLQSKFSDKHPDVRKTKTEIAQLEKRLKNTSSKTQGKAGNSWKPTYSPLDQPDNPAYVQLAAQLVSVQAEIETVKSRLAQLNQRRNDYYRRMESSPRVEEAYKVLLTERNNTQIKVDDLMKKMMEAKIAVGLEKERMGERFTIIDPARLPEKPVKPNVPAILLIGLFLGAGAGIGMVSLKEFNDRSVKNPAALASITRLPVLAAIPEIVTARDIENRKKLKKKIIIIAILTGLIAIIMFHFFVMDLDILWARLSRKLS